METVNTNQQVPPVQNIEQSQSAPLSNPPSHSKIFIIVVGIVLIVVFGIGSYVLSVRTDQTAIQTQQPTSSPTVSQPSPTPDPTANWKIYRNTKYGYTLRYPPTWTEKVRCEGGASEDDYICFLSIDFEESLAGAGSGGLIKGGLISIDARNGGFLAQKPFNEFCQSNRLEQVSSCKQTIVDNHNAWQRTINSYQTHIIVLQEGKIVLTMQAYHVKGSEKEILATFDQILSTFRFTD